MAALSSLTLKQLATRVVVREDLPIKDLPNTLKRELEALAMLPGSYTIIGESKELGKVGGGNLTRDEEVRVNGVFMKMKRKSALLGAVGQKIQVSVINTTTGTEKEKQWHVKRNAGPRVQNLYSLRNKVTEEKVVGNGTRVVGQLLVDEGRFTHKSCGKEMGSMMGSMFISMFINKEGMLVMSSRMQRKGFEWSYETTAQRD